MLFKNIILALLAGVAIGNPYPKPDASLSINEERAPKKKPVALSPLKTPGAKAGLTAVLGFMKTELAKVTEETTLHINPDPDQLVNWKITGPTSGLPIPISTTSEWHEFGNERLNFAMRELTGCTATMILTPFGLWAGHIWESAQATPNAGGFMGYKDGDATRNTPRSAEDFKAIAVDIMTMKKDYEKMPTFGSISHRKTQIPKLFEDGVSVFVMTKAESKSSPKPMYLDNVNALTAKYVEAIGETATRSSKIVNLKTYIGKTDQYASTFPVELKGVVLVQYTPYEVQANGKQMAMARVYYENTGVVAAELKWEAKNGQK